MSTVSLAEVRLVQRLRQGEPEALAALWAQWRTPVWSLCSGMAEDRDQALLLLRDIYRCIPMVARGWDSDAPLCCHMSTLVYDRLCRQLELPALAGIEVALPDHTETPARSDVATRLQQVAPELRVIYLLDVFFRCPSATLAELAGCEEQDIRKARAQVAYALVSGAGGAA